MRFILSVLFLVVTQIFMCGATWTDQGNYDTSWYDDLSSSFDIYTPEQFAGFVFLSNNNTSFEGKTINIRADLDMGKYDFPMCEDLAGTLNGNGYTISNVIINIIDGPIKNSKAWASIFLNISETGVVQAVNIANASISLYNHYNEYVGGIACENHGIISDSSFEGLVSANHIGVDIDDNYYVGGIVAYNYGTIINCSHFGDVKGLPSLNSLYYDVYAGGIAGYNEGIIVNCINYGDILAQARKNYKGGECAWVGGICGTSKSAIKNVINLANVSASGYTEYVKADGICPSGQCLNAYYSSSINISAPTITKNGTLLSIEQIRNKTLDFTTLLNDNLSDVDITPITYWANSPDYNNNEPFLLNSLNLNLQCNGISQSSINVDCLPLQLTSSWIVEKGFEYQKSGSSIVNTIVIKDAFCAELRDLDAETIYNIRAYIKGKTGTVYSKYISVQTSPLNIQTLAATDITPVSAVLNGKINVGNTPIKSQGFLWKELNGDYHVILTNGSNFSAKIDNLKPSTTYVYQAYAIDENDNSIYGDEVNFKTTPVTISVDDKAVNINDIVIGGHINLELATDISVEYRKIGAGDYIRKNATSDKQGIFSLAINELEADMEYELRAYFMYDNVTLYSSVEVVHTLPIEVSTLIPFVDRHVEFYGEINGISKNGEFGFEYRETNIPDIIPSKFIIGATNGNKFNAVTSDVVNGINYKVRAYYKSKSGVYCYGQWIEFQPVNVASIGEIITDDEISIKAIYNSNGQKISSFAKGINIVIYSNGTSKKVILK